MRRIKIGVRYIPSDRVASARRDWGKSTKSKQGNIVSLLIFEVRRVFGRASGLANRWGGGGSGCLWKVRRNKGKMWYDRWRRRFWGVKREREGIVYSHIRMIWGEVEGELERVRTRVAWVGGAWWGMSSGRSNGLGDGVGRTIMSF